MKVDAPSLDQAINVLWRCGAVAQIHRRAFDWSSGATGTVSESHA